MEPLTAAEVAERLQASGSGVTADEADRLAAYLNELAHWNRIHNLIGTRDPKALIDRHLAESLALSPYVAGPTAADIGSGAGLPGLPLAIRLTEVEFTLIESRRKRVSFLRHVAATLGLGNVTVAHGRAESLELPPFASVLARAVAAPAELLALVDRLVGPGGRLLLLTSEDRAREILGLASAYRGLANEPAGPNLKSRIVVLERPLC